MGWQGKHIERDTSWKNRACERKRISFIAIDNGNCDIVIRDD